MKKSLLIVLFFAISIFFISPNSSLKTAVEASAPTLVELVPSETLSSWYQTNTGNTPNATNFGPYVFYPVGDTIYIGLGTARAAESNGGAVAKIQNNTLTFLGELDEQGVHDFDYNHTTGTLYIAGSDPSNGDDWLLGNFYTYTSAGGFVKHRADAGLNNVIHMWGITQDQNGDIYVAVSSHDGSVPVTCVDGVTCFGEVFKSTDGGESFTAMSHIGLYRAFDIKYFNGKFFVIHNDDYGNPESLSMSNDSINWSATDLVSTIRRTRITQFGDKLVLLDWGLNSIHTIDINGVTAEYPVPEPVGIYYLDSPHYSNYNQFVVDDYDNFYYISASGNILRSKDLVEWETLLTSDEEFISIAFWSETNQLVLGTRGTNAKVYTVDIPTEETTTPPPPPPTVIDPPVPDPIPDPVPSPEPQIDPVEVNLCGNGMLDEGEECDPELKVENSCSEIAHKSSGKVSCTSECKLDYSQCKIKSSIITPPRYEPKPVEIQEPVDNTFEKVLITSAVIASGGTLAYAVAYLLRKATSI